MMYLISKQCVEFRSRIPNLTQEPYLLALLYATISPRKLSTPLTSYSPSYFPTFIESRGVESPSYSYSCRICYPPSFHSLSLRGLCVFACVCVKRCDAHTHWTDHCHHSLCHSLFLLFCLLLPPPLSSSRPFLLYHYYYHQLFYSFASAYIGIAGRHSSLPSIDQVNEGHL